VAHHYDLGEEFFRLFLDKNMHYSCAYFSGADDSLERAQVEKCRHIAQKLLLQPGQRVLDIGCGWGSLACYLARTFDVEVVGITLSKHQLTAARQRAQALGLGNVSFELHDYREHTGRYDRIVSVGMFEHVGAPFYAAFFQSINKLLVYDGAALVHSIGRSGPPGVVNPWIGKHIFPGGHIPSLSEMALGAEKTRLMLTDIEVLRLHYAKTLRVWFDRFQLHRDEISRQMGEEFCRMWEFYLAVCEVSFECSDLVVFQLQLARQHHVVPITRDYMYSTAVNRPELCDLQLPN
jgi:cyclopropane-fatty-acyl-phospholipid synthase